MAYQNVGTPRFYIDIYSYLQAIGLGGEPDEHFSYGLNPTTQGSYEFTSTNASPSDFFKYELNSLISEDITRNLTHNKSVIGFLGHNFGSLGIAAGVKLESDADSSFGAGEGIVNWDHIDDAIEHDGFSLYKTTFAMDDGEFSKYTMRVTNLTYETVTVKLGSLFLGTYYDMPHSPDLNLKLSYEYDGVKNIQTKGGATLSNASYTKPADWGNMGAWQLSQTLDNESQSAVPSNLRSGRRVWDLSFSYLSSTDTFPVNASGGYQAYTNNAYHTDTLNPTTGIADISTTSDTGGTAGAFNSNISGGTDFFSQVWNRTMGGHLPFIFQPDGGADVEGAGNFNPDQFSIARFDMKSLQYDQVANNVYNVKLKIRECW